jgi:putative endonuclease
MTINERPMRNFYVYMLVNKKGGIFYTGITSNLPKRIYEHKNELADGFTKKYNIKILVYYEVYDDFDNAVRREKRLKRWNRDWKIKAVEEMNPEWKDLYYGLNS